MMYSLIENIFGEYTPITYEQTIVLDAAGTTSTFEVVPAGMAGVDIQYLAGVVLFCVSIYCLFRIIGGIINNA